MSERARAGVLGATGAVGQRLLERLDGHPSIQVVRVMASSRSIGRPFAEACEWRLATPIPEAVAGLTVTDTTPDPGLDLVFSALGGEVAGPVEEAWARAGAWVFSNAGSHRMDDDVPLLIPEVNPDHLDLIDTQRAERGWPGAIVTNANCSATFLAMALAPLEREFGVEVAMVVTLQAISGAGYPGVPSMAIHGNVIPQIRGEEEKIETEVRKILGRLEGTAVEPAPMVISAQVHRVPVLDGHTEAVSVRLAGETTLEAVRAAIEGFEGEPQRLELPSAPVHPLLYVEGDDRPQPALDLYREEAMATLVGRLRPCPVLDYRMVLLGHNTVRGAGPGSVLNAEYAMATGRLEVGR